MVFKILFTNALVADDEHLLKIKIPYPTFHVNVQLKWILLSPYNMISLLEIDIYFLGFSICKP